ncbi:MAG: hypothetical protein WAV05_07075 [Anaerolineales bacterium]
MSDSIDYSTDFIAFFRDLFPVEGDYGPQAIIPPFLEEWLRLCFPLPDGLPGARNICDFRTKKEGKSTLSGAVGLFTASRRPYSEVVIVSNDKDQSKDRILRAIKYAISHGPLAPHAKVYSSVIEIDNSSVIQALPADWQGSSGGNYDLVLIDEMHSWVYESQRRLFDELLPPPSKPHSFRWIASYAGWLGESLLLKEWWDRALAGERISSELPIYKDEKASMLAFLDVGSESWRMPWMTGAYLQQIRTTERPSTFKRIWENQWVSSESQFLPDGAWDLCYSKDVKPLMVGDGRRVVLGVDGATTRDFAAMVGTSFNQETNTSDVLYCRVWKPVKGALRLGKPTIDLREGIGKEVIRLHKNGQLSGIIADPYQLHDLILEWEKAGIRVMELPQTTGRIESDQFLYDSVISRMIRHYGDEILNEHVRNAVALETPRGLRITKEKTSMKIDACVALSMSLYGVGNYQRGGGVTSLPNLFYGTYEGASLSDFINPGGAWVYAPEANRKKHKPGITWRNCPHRNKGCQSCIDELTEEGFYRLDEEMNKNIIPMGERDAMKDFLSRIGQNISQKELDDEYKIKSTFRRAINLKRMEG